MLRFPSLLPFLPSPSSHSPPPLLWSPSVLYLPHLPIPPSLYYTPQEEPSPATLTCSVTAMPVRQTGRISLSMTSSAPTLIQTTISTMTTGETPSPAHCCPTSQRNILRLLLTAPCGVFFWNTFCKEGVKVTKFRKGGGGCTGHKLILYIGLLQD